MIFCNVAHRKRRPELKALRIARADAGLTISEVAARAGVSRDTVSKLEKGQHSPQASTLNKIARALGKTPSELLAEEESYPKAQPPPLEVFGASEWETAAAKFEAFQGTAGERMDAQLRAWQKEKEVWGDSAAARAARRPYLDEMARILEEAARHRHELVTGISSEGNLALERFAKAQEADGLLQDLRKQVADAGLYLYDGEDVRRARVEEAPAA